MAIVFFLEKISVINFKTKSKPPDKGWQEKQFLQCTGYAKMYEEMTDKQIDQLVIILTTPEKTFLYTCDSKKYREILIPKLEREVNSFWREIIAPDVKL